MKISFPFPLNSAEFNGPLLAPQWDLNSTLTEVDLVCKSCHVQGGN